MTRLLLIIFFNIFLVALCYPVIFECFIIDWPFDNGYYLRYSVPFFIALMNVLLFARGGWGGLSCVYGESCFELFIASDC